jgi:hypothetical protein
MSSYTERFSEGYELLANLSPQAANGTVGEHNTGWVNVENYHRLVVILTAGEPGGASTIDVDFEEATDNAGTGAQNVAGKAITQLVAADAGDTVYVEVRTAELDVNNDYVWVNAEVTVAVNTYTYDLKLYGRVTRYAPVSVTNIAEIVD